SSQDAGRKTTPSSGSPVVTKRHSAMTSLRASATIIVLRVPLALLIGDAERGEVARADLLRLHREVMEIGHGPWWFAFDRLVTAQNAGLTEEERQRLVDDLEQIVAERGDASKRERFDPHVVQDAAKRLIKHYKRLRRSD